MKKGDKKRLLWLLAIISFVLLIFLWLIFGKIYSPKKKNTNEDLFFKNLGNQISSFNKKFEELLESFKHIRLTGQENKNFLNSEGVDQNKLTNEEMEKLKTKVLEYVNKNQEVNQ